MRTLRFLTLIVAAGLFLALASTPLSMATGKTHDIVAEITSVDVASKTISFRDDAGKAQSASVMAEAIEALKSVKVGDRAVLTCQDNDSGGHEGIIAIKRNAIDKP